MRSSLRKQTHHDRTTFAQRTVPSYSRTSRHQKKPRHYAGEVPRTSAPEALRCEIPREPHLPVIRRPAIPTVLPPNQPTEIPVVDVPDVPEVNNLPLRSRYGRLYKPPIRYEA